LILDVVFFFNNFDVIFNYFKIQNFKKKQKNRFLPKPIRQSILNWVAFTICI